MRRIRIPPFMWVLFPLFLIYLFNTIFSNLDHYPIIDNTTIDKEAYSTGDKILIHKIPYYENYENYDKQHCIDNWELKEALDFQEFLEKCPEDVESRIYLNNKEAYSQANNSKDNIIAQIAIVVPISGKKSQIYTSEEKVNGERVFYSFELLKGIEIAQHEINISEVIKLGAKRVFLEVLIVDDSYVDTIDVEEKAQRVANYLVENQDTVGVIGHFSSDSIQAAAGIYKKNKLVAFSPTSTAERRKNNNRFFSILNSSEKLKLNSYIFRTSPNDITAIDRLVTIIKRDKQANSIKNVVILYEPENNFSRLYRKGFKEQFLNDIKNTEVFEDVDFLSCQFYPKIEGDNQYSNCVNFIKSKKPDALLLVPSSEKAIEIIDDKVLHTIKDFEHKPQLLGADTMFNEKFLSERAEGMIVVAPLKTRMFKEKTRMFKEIQLSWRGAMTYDATKAIIKGIEDSKCDSNSSSNINDCLRKQIKSVLSNKDFKADGILGQKSVFFKNGDRQVSDALNSELAVPLQVKKNKDDKYTFVHLNYITE